MIKLTLFSDIRGKCIKAFSSALAVLLFCLVPTQPLLSQDACQSVIGNVVANCGFQSVPAYAFWNRIGPSITYTLTSVASEVHSGTVAAKMVNSDRRVSHDAVLTQNLQTVVGATYQIIFWARSDNVQPLSLDLTFGNQVFTNIPVSNTYVPFTFNSLAVNSISTLFQFDFLVPSSRTVFLDSISVVCTANCVQIPEPSTWLTLGSAIGLSLLLGAMPKRTVKKSII